MSDTAAGADPPQDPTRPTAPRDPPAAAPTGGPSVSAALSAIADAVGERRQAPRVNADLPCTVFAGPHVHDGVIRDVSAGGALLRGVPGLIAGDTVRLRLSAEPDQRIAVRVRAISLLGAHLAIEDDAASASWRQAVRDLLP